MELHLPGLPSSQYQIRSLAGIKHLVIHRIDVGETASDIATWFQANPQYTGGKMGYHFVIRRDGTIDSAVSVNLIAPGAKKLNPTGIQIALVGDFRKRPPAPAQALPLVELCAFLSSAFAGCSIIGHDEVQGASSDPNKECPGRHLNLEGLRQAVAQALVGTATHSS